MLLPDDMTDLIESLQSSGMAKADIVFMDHEPSHFKQVSDYQYYVVSFMGLS